MFGRRALDIGGFEEECLVIVGVVVEGLVFGERSVCEVLGEITGVVAGCVHSYSLIKL